MPRLTARTRLAGIIGWPVAHSRSPLLHNAWAERHGLDAAYVPLPVAPDDLPRAVHGLRAAGFAGANVTIPHKEAAYALCDVLLPPARRAGAVNTLIFDERGIVGTNTDGEGFVESLRAGGVDPRRGPALLLGAGGAARAIAASLLDLGVAVSVANRSGERAERLAADLPGLARLPWEAREAALADHALLVNTTSLGMAGHGPLLLELDRAPSGLAVADIVYVPLETELIARARAAGLLAVGGLGMLLYQAGAGFAAWFGVRPVVDEAVTSLLAADIDRAA